MTRNWVAETLRFAPTLRPRLLANSTDTTVFDDMQAGDLILVSYGLLSFVEEELLGQRFATVILGRVVEETGEYDGQDEPELGPWIDKPFPRPEWARVTIHRFREQTLTVLLADAAQSSRST